MRLKKALPRKWFFPNDLTTALFFNGNFFSESISICFIPSVHQVRGLYCL